LQLILIHHCPLWVATQLAVVTRHSMSALA
jgi:hypothetical protein